MRDKTVTVTIDWKCRMTIEFFDTTTSDSISKQAEQCLEQFVPIHFMPDKHFASVLPYDI